MLQFETKCGVLACYQLWLSWESLRRQGDGKIFLYKPIFWGPVTQDCDPMEKKGRIVLDFTDQYLVELLRPYEVELRWENKISQEAGKILFEKMTIQDTELGSIHKLISKYDAIMIDCKGHHSDDIERGHFATTFKSFIFNEFGEPYQFS